MAIHEPVFTRLHLIRHGQTAWNEKKLIQGILDDIPLNDTGLQQAEAVAENLKRNYHVDVIYASKAERAQQTALKICEIFEKELQVTSDLNEIDFGVFSGSSIYEIETKFPEYFEAFRHFIATNRDQGTKRPAIPDGEPLTDIENRINTFVAEILREHSGRQIAAVSHGSFIKCLITTFSGESIHNYMPYWVENASISVIDFFGTIPIIRRLNDTSHLDQGTLDFAVPRII
jgi:phosphoserine phosphatase